MQHGWRGIDMVSGRNLSDLGLMVDRQKLNDIICHALNFGTLCSK